MKKLAALFALLGVLVACVPNTSTQAKFVGTWQGKDPYDQSNIVLTITKENTWSNRYDLGFYDDATDPGFCGTSATGFGSAEPEGDDQLRVNVLWTCDDKRKPTRFFPTVVTHNRQDDTVTAYGSIFKRRR